MKRKKVKTKPADVWDGWAPTQAMRDRAAAARPFWADWPQLHLESLEELSNAFRLRCSASLVSASDLSRVGKHAGADLSEGDADIYRRFVAWLAEMRARPHLRAYLGTMQGILVREDPPRQIGYFEQAIQLHLDVRKRDINHRH